MKSFFRFFSVLVKVRMLRENKELYEFGNFRLDVGERKLYCISGESNGSLPEKAFQTLVYLVRNSGTLVGKQELLSAIWPDTIVEENNLGKAIHAIRQHLGEKSRVSSNQPAAIAERDLVCLQFSVCILVSS